MYSPLSLSSLPPNVRHHLQESDVSSAPQIPINSVRSRIVKAKKPVRVVPGDLPKKIVQRCVDELAYPVSMIFQKITSTAEYPKKWKIEHQIAIPKCTPPSDLSDLRNIAKTSFFSKV